ncbi:MAG: hypothetical protein ACSHX7_00155 [Luteolibacter sp.]
MKAKLSICALTFMMAFNAIGETNHSLRMEAKIEGKATYDRGKSKSKTQTRKIEVTLTNTSQNALDGAVVKWVIYGHDMKNHQKLKVIKEGEEKTSIPANDRKVVETAETKITGNREYKVTSKSRSKSGGKSRSKTTVVSASGEDYYGYAVKIYTDGRLVASYYSKPSIEKDMHPDP